MSDAVTVRFGDFELVEAQRELRLCGRVLETQPRVFDVLCYLIRHRQRVVSKQELLDELWGDTIVTDSSVQRAVSLARGLLRTGGLENAIRAHLKQGYRFVVDVSAEPTPASDVTPIMSARHAHARGQWETAARIYAECDAAQRIDTHDLMHWSEALRRLGRLVEAIDPLERAVAGFALAGEASAAARAAVTLTTIQFERGNFTVAAGWYRRALNFVDEDSPSHELGLLKWTGARLARMHKYYVKALQLTQQGRDMARTLGDLEVEALCLLEQALNLSAQGQVDKAMDLLDETAASALSGDLQWEAATLIFRKVVWECMRQGDYQRSSEWFQEWERWSRRVGNDVVGVCELIRAELLLVAGEIGGARAAMDRSWGRLRDADPAVQGHGHALHAAILRASGQFDAGEIAQSRARELGHRARFRAQGLSQPSGAPA